MKFFINRASDLSCTKCPCEEATETSKEDYEKYREKYEVEMETLDELSYFVKRYGYIIIGETGPGPEQVKNVITIYDDYME